MNKYLLFLIAFTLVCIPAVAIDVTTCGTLDQDGATYNLLNDINTTLSNSNCLTVSASNIIFNGNDHNIQFLGAGYWDNILITGNNNTLFNFTSNYGDGFGVYIKGNNNSIHNFESSGNMGDGIDSDTASESNYINNFTLINNIGNGYAGISPIIFKDGTIYNNIGKAIWWNVNKPIFINVFGIIAQWSQDNLTWYNIDDSSQSNMATAYFNLTNLYLLRNYTVYNNSIAVSTLKTDGLGVLPQFSIDLSNLTTEIKVLAEAVAPIKKKKHRAIIIN